MIATGFHRTLATNVEAGTDQEEGRVNQVFDRVNTTAAVWLGSTFECAQCHNHKYDPILQKDYYQLFAFFNNTPQETDFTTPQSKANIKFTGPFLTLPDPEKEKLRPALQARLAELEREFNTERTVALTRLEAWEKSALAARAATGETHPFDLMSFESLGESSYKILPDKSVLLIDDAPDHDTYKITVTTKLTGITGFKLEALTDPSLPGMGPGRGDRERPNFILNHIGVTAAAAGNRRTFLKHTGLGLGGIALNSLLAESLFAAAPASSAPGSLNPLAPHPPHFPPRAKRIIYLHMVGAPSQLDLFDFKPELQKYDGQPCPEELIKGKRFAFLRGHPKIAATKFAFQRHGGSGAEISELLPNLARVADEITLVKSVHTDEFNHGPAQLFLHTGFGRLGRPSFGSWVTYGLGSENEDLPAYIVLLSGPLAGAGTSLWSSGFLPSVHQGVQFRSSGEPVLFLNNPAGQSPPRRRQVLDTVQQLNCAQLADVGDPEIATRISQYEMAFRMQTSVPELMDIGRESKQTLALYGAEPGKASFGNNCLLARRLIERGVRMVQLYDADWDHHADLGTRLPRKCKDVDQGMAALIVDLKQRGLLDDTLVIWGGEFGRTPMAQSDSGSGTLQINPGRDHHKDAFTMWMAGGGVKRGFTYGKTDDLGYSIVENPVHVHDLNATILHLLGLDHERLTYRYQGRDFRLTDVHGKLVNSLLA